MICLICRQTEIVEGLTSVKFEGGKTHLVINNVPAWLCPSCREAYVDEKVAMQLLEVAEEMSQAGGVDVESEYDAA